MVNQRAIVLLGDFSDDRRVIDPVARQFECRIESAPNLDCAVELCGSRQVSAVLVNTKEGGICLEAVRAELEWRGVPVVACFGFHDVPPERELKSCYHTLRLPLDYAEFRQCLGFLSQALRSGFSTRTPPPRPVSNPATKWSATCTSINGRLRPERGSYVT
jgi:hypothetical protein